MGTHDVILHARHYNSQRLTLRLADESDRRDATLEVQLEPVDYQVDLHVRPANATLLIDDKAINDYAGCELRRISLPVGTYHVRLRADDYQEYAQLLNIQADRTETITLTQLAHSSVYLDTYPQNAQVLIDGQAVGTTPLPWRGTVGKHRIRIVQTGYQDLETTLNVPKLDYAGATGNAPTAFWYLERVR